MMIETCFPKYAVWCFKNVFRTFSTPIFLDKPVIDVFGFSWKIPNKSFLTDPNQKQKNIPLRHGLWRKNP